MSTPTESQVSQALREVIDPEIGVNVVDLGLVYRVDIDGDDVRVAMTMTTPACPLGPYLADAAEQAIQRGVPGVASVTVQTVWEPPWTPDRMSEAGRRQLGWSDGQ